jgi:hypothetical protein
VSNDPNNPTLADITRTLAGTPGHSVCYRYLLAAKDGSEPTEIVTECRLLSVTHEGKTQHLNVASSSYTKKLYDSEDSQQIN